MKFKFLILFGLVFFCFVGINPVIAAEYYVSITGSDAGTGGVGAPFKTFKKANSVLAPGDTLYVVAGNYSEPLIIDKSGLVGNPIFVKSLNGVKPVVDVQNNSGSSIWIRGSWINLSDFVATNSTSMGVRINGSNVLVERVEVSNVPDHGIVTFGKDIVVRDSIVHDSMTANAPNWDPTLGWVYPGGGWGSGFKVGQGAENIVFEQNTSYHNYGEGMAVTMGKNVTLRNNRSYDNYSVNIYVDNSTGVLITNNLVTCSTGATKYYRNGAPATGILMGEESYSGWGAMLGSVTITNNISYGCKGINFYGSEVADGGLKTALIANNTIWKIPNSGVAVGIASEPNNRDIRILNNIAAGQITSGVGIVADRNLSAVVFAGIPSEDPMSYMLKNGSAAIDGGIPLTEVTDDFGGRKRIGGLDIGAWEYLSEVVPTNTVSPAVTVTVPVNTTVPVATVIPPTSTVTPIVTITTPISTVTPVATSLPRLMGDASGNGAVDLVDFDIWKREYLGQLNTTTADFDATKTVDLVDFSIWKTAYLF